MATNDRTSAEDAICALCGQTYGQHAGTAFTAKSNKGWRWAKSACPVGASPFHPTQIFNAGGAVVDAPDELSALRLRVEELTQENETLRHQLSLAKHGFRNLIDRSGKSWLEVQLNIAKDALAQIEDAPALTLKFVNQIAELTHERDEARKAEAHYLREWLTTSEELGEARQARWIELEQETDGRWLAEYKGIPGMMVYGATIGEALRKLADLLQQSEERAFGIT